MIKHCLFFVLALFSVSFLNPGSLISEEQQTIRQKLENEIPLPPSLREGDKKQAPREDNFRGEFLNMLMTLGAIITILLVASWLLKRMASTRVLQINESSLIKILERRSINAKTSVYLLDIKGKQIAIAESTSGLLLLPEVPNDQEE